MSALKQFAFDGQPVRTVEIEGEPWFIGKDVAERLGYTNPNKAMADHCKGVANHHPLQTAGGMQEMRILSEPDVLRLIIGSKLPAAERFERWVFEEVLPSVRKTGRYGETDNWEPSVKLKLEMVKEARRIAGSDEAVKVWNALGLPQIGAAPSPPSFPRSQVVWREWPITEGGG
ncbi:Bro-N domain-containing protein [Aureimonas sp. AU12]|uniref:BRO-N domain-containing protein n=1 Tax=Aureimonas sp. AU12 TaxID=1638161 RepID=UPI0009E6932F|nr:Bro-N domain-containing protein [Aureimonas sp. AU12]